MTAKSIVEVEIKDGQFKAFYEMFQKYQKQLEDMPDDWKQVVDVIDDAGDGMKSFAKASMSSKDFMMIAAIQADAISKAMQKATGVQDKFNTRAKDGAIQMGKMAKASKEMHKDISTMSSVLLKLSAVGGSILTLPAAVLASTNALAGQNVQARSLGLRIGQTQAFEANFEKYGLNASDLANTANAQGDMSKWGAYLAAGLSPSQIQNEDAEQLTYDYYKAASSKFREWQKSGAPAASLAQSYGFTNQFSLQQLRAGASYTDADLAASQKKELEDARKNAVDQATADKASDVKASLKSDWAQVMNTFNDQIATASPELKLLGDSAAAAAVNLLKVAGPEAKAVLDALQGAPVSREDAAKGGVVGGLATVGYWLRDKLGIGELPNTSVLESANGLPAGLLAAQAMAESSGNPNAKSPKGALGLMQFMGPTARQYGVDDPTDPAQAIRGASYYDRDLLKRYGGDIRKALAAYNWGMGNAKDPRLDADIAKNGANWEAHIPAATEAYINKVVGLMAKQGQTVNINITNSTTANVATSMNAAPH
jgi:soluble lytic murein transglycosylase-like protein